MGVCCIYIWSWGVFGGGAVAFVWGGALRQWGGGGSVYIFPGFFASVEGTFISGETGHWAIIL